MDLETIRCRYPLSKWVLWQTIIATDCLGLPARWEVKHLDQLPPFEWQDWLRARELAGIQMSSNVVDLLHSRWLCCQGPSPRLLSHPAQCTDVHCMFRGVNPEMGHNSLIALLTPPPCALCFQCYNRAELAHECELVSSQR